MTEAITLEQIERAPTIAAEPNYRWRSKFDRLSICSLEIRKLDGGQLISLVTELDNNPGLSVTNGAEELCSNIKRNYPKVTQHFETYRPGEIDQVCVSASGFVTWAKVSE
jgi:hypothetical protein